MGNARALAATLAILAASAVTPAVAGPCSGLIDRISKSLASQTNTASATNVANVANVADVTPAPDKRLALAQQELDRARALDVQGDPTCREAAYQARQLAKRD